MKTKFICLKHLETAMIFEQLRISKFKGNIPYYNACKTKNGKFTLNIFKCKGEINYKDIKYVKITCNKSYVDKLDLSDYKYMGEEVKVANPDKKCAELLSIETSAVLMPVEIFNVILTDTRITEYSRDLYTNKLSSILLVANTPYSIKLLNEDKKTIGYAVQIID